jgi:hypothetical protein
VRAVTCPSPSVSDISIVRKDDVDNGSEGKNKKIALRDEGWSELLSRLKRA